MNHMPVGATTFPKLAAVVLGGLATLGSRSASAADPTTAVCLSANENSIALRGQHKLRDARSQSLVCAAVTCPVDVRTECARRVEQVNASMPTLVFEAKDADGNDLSGVRVTMDERPLVERLEGTALSVDPGEHKFSFETKEYPTVWKQLVIREGEKDRRERITFGTPSTPQSRSLGATRGAEREVPPPTDGNDTGTDPGRTQRILGWTGTGLGAVGLALGVVFVIQRNSKNSAADSICPLGVGCKVGDNDRIRSFTDEANTKGSLAAVSFIAGGALVAGGLVVAFTAPGKTKVVSVAPALAPNFKGLLLVARGW